MTDLEREYLVGFATQEGFTIDEVMNHGDDIVNTAMFKGYVLRVALREFAVALLSSIPAWAR